MNLKEAFRFQNKLQKLMDEAASILEQPGNAVKVKSTYLRKKAIPEAENETTLTMPSHEYADQITQLAGFLLWLLGEREALSHAIRQVKHTLPIDMDSEVRLNTTRQEIAGTFRYLVNLRSSEVLIPNGGIGYRFNAEGNQIAYKCDVERVTTINFDRNVIRKQLSALNKRSDEISAQLDSCLVNSEVDYHMPFDVNDSFSDVFEIYLAS